MNFTEIIRMFFPDRQSLKLSTGLKFSLNYKNYKTF